MSCWVERAQHIRQKFVVCVCLKNSEDKLLQMDEADGVIGAGQPRAAWHGA